MEGAEVCIFFGIFITKSLCNLLLTSCTKLLDDGIGRDTFGGEDGSEPSNQKDIESQSVARIRNSLGFVVLNANQTGLGRLTGRSILVPHEGVVFGFEVGDLHEMVLIEPTNVPVLEVTTNLLNGLKLEVGCRARMEKGA